MKKIIVTGNTTWVLEATLNLVKGIDKIIPGQYSLNGYEFSSHPKEYLFAVSLEIDETEISLHDFLAVFYNVHTPFLNSWIDEDCFYPLCRSAIFTNEEDELNPLINKQIEELNKSKFFEKPIDTKVSIIIPKNFKPDPKANINFYKRFKEDGLSTSVIEPRIDKLKSNLPHLLKKDI